MAKCFDQVLTSLYAESYLAIYSMEGIIQGQVDLSSYIPAGDLDGSPEAASIVHLGNSAYVALQQLDLTGGPVALPTGPGLVIEVDCGSFSVLNSWEVGPNPDITAVGNSLLIRTGSYGQFDGGVRHLDTLSNTLSPLYFEDMDYGVWFSGVTGTESGKIAINGFDVNTYESVLLCGDESGVIEIERSDSSYYTHITTSDRDEFWLSTDQGIRIFDSDSCAEITNSPIETSLAPSNVVFY